VEQNIGLRMEHINMNRDRYLIDDEQLYRITHYKDMFELNANEIKALCDDEKSDIVYGFELGQIFSNLRKCFIEMMQLEREIQLQRVKDEDEEKEIDPEIEAREFCTEKLKVVNTLLSSDYKTGFQEGIEKYLTEKLIKKLE